jgi:hypothetical protein
MKKFLLGFCMVILFACFALAQTTPPITIDPAIIATILNLTFVFGGGFTVMGLSEMLKRLLWPNETTRPKWSGYLSSTIVALAATAGYLVIFNVFTILGFILYSLFVFLSANGIYKAN